MKQGMHWIREHKGSIIVAGIALLVIVLGFGIWGLNQEEVSMPNDSIIIDVNTEMDHDVTKYVQGMKHPERAIANWDVVDVKKVGMYDVTISYRDIDYVLHVDVRDRIKPQLKADPSEFVFPLNTSLEEINQTIDAAITVSDNYDQEFAPMRVVKEIPMEAQEITYPIRAKDSAGNESDPLEIKVIYQTPSLLPAQGGETTVQGNHASNAAPTQHPSQGNHQGSTQPPQGYKPVAPEGAMEGKFSSFDEADAWIASYTDNPDSEWYLAVGFMRQLPDGTWWAYIKKP